jgi:CDP-diacylglycerol--glycerol-3-phosphate 3-phosphatidyltransferase
VAYRIGAPVWIVLLTYVTASTQEYARARLGGLGINEVGVVTPAERPVRASFIFIALVAYAIDFNLVTPVMAVLAALQLFSFYLVGRWAHNCLRNDFSA